MSDPTTKHLDDDTEVIENLDLLMDMDVLEKEESWTEIEESDKTDGQTARPNQEASHE